MSNIEGLTALQQVKLDLFLKGGLPLAQVDKCADFIFSANGFEPHSDKQKPFKVLPENPKFMSVITVDSGIEVNIRMSDITAFFSEGGHLKIIIEKLEIDAAGTIAQFKSFMESHIDEWGSF